MSQQSNQQQEMEHLLDDWANWPCFHDRPEVRRKLGGGTYNEAWLLGRGAEQMVLRRRRALRGNMLNPPGRLDFAVEAHAARRASYMHLGPTIHHSDPAREYLLMDYLPQNPEATMGKKPLTDRFDNILQTLEQVPHQGLPRMDYRHWVLDIWKAASMRGPAVLTPVAHWRTFLIKAATHLNRDVKCFCHNDINPGNVLLHESQLQMVDWEYSAIGNRYMDIAAILFHFPVNNRQLLQKYPDQTSLLAARTLTSFSSYIWYRAMEPQQEQAARWQKELTKYVRQLHDLRQARAAG